MDLLAIQIESPRHVAWSVRAGVADSTPMNSAIMLLYATHRLLRMVCGTSRTFGASHMGRFDEMITYLLESTEQDAGRASSGLPPSVSALLRVPGTRDAIKDLGTTAASLITPEIVASKTPREWLVVVDGLSGILKGLLPLASAMRTAAGDGRGSLHVAVGPDGNAILRVPENTSHDTVILLSDGTACEEYGPAFTPRGADATPEPLIPWPSESRQWETVDGTAVNDDGTTAGPTGNVNAGRALGRLLAWARQDSWETAGRLARISSGDTAVEYLLVRTTGSDEWRSPASLQKLIDFVNEHSSTSAQFREYALGASGLSEAAALENGDFSGAAGILVVRQQLETGTDKARTLRKLANIYLDKLDDRTAAQLCMVKALEAAPADTSILTGLLDLTGEFDPKANDHGLTEVATGMLRLAGDLEGTHEELPVLKTTATLLEKIGDYAAADRINSRILDIDANSIEHFERLASRLAGPADVLEECSKRLRQVWKSEARGRYLLHMAAALRQLGRLQEAATCLKEASASLPDTVELLDTMHDTLAEAGDWAGLLGLVKRRAELLQDPESIKAAALEMADIALDRMQSPVIALASLTRVAHLADPQIHRRMLAIHGELGMWNEAAADMEIVSASTGLPGDLVALARIYRDKLGRPGDSAIRFKAALEHMEDRELAQTALELADLPGMAEDDAAVTGILKRAVEATSDDLLKATLLKRLGGTAASGASATANASAIHLEEALRLNPNDHECAIRLAEIYLAGDMAEKAAAILEPPIKAARTAGDTGLEAKLRLMAAGAASRCFDYQGAARHLKRVLEIAPGDVEATRRLVKTRLALSEVDDAIGLMRAMSAANGAMTPADAALLRDLGRAQAGRGEFTDALDSLDQAWQLDSDSSEDILRELADTASSAGDLGAMVRWLKRLVHNESKSPRRFTDLIRLGDAVRASGDVEAALEWYMTAAGEDYSKKVALHKALEVSMEAGHMARAATLLTGIIDEEQDDLKKSDYHLAAALLFRDNLNDDHAVVDHLRKALDLNPDNEPAAQALDAKLLDLGMFDELTESLNLRARHFRMSGDEPHLLDTLRKLGDVYESKLHNAARAAEIFAQIMTIDPRDQTALRHLAYCQARIPGAEGEALQTIRKVIALDPTSVDSYRALRDLSILTSDNDLATRASCALIVLGQGDESDFNLASRNRSAALHLKADQIPQDVFTRRIAFDLDTQVARIFSLLYLPVLRTIPIRKPADLGLSDRDRVDMGEDGLFQKMADAVGHVFNMDLPEFWYAPGTKGMKKAPFAVKGIVVGDDLISTRRGKDLRYSLSRAVVSFMPGAELCGVLDAAAMRLFFLAALKMAFPDYAIPEDARAAGDFVPSLSKNLREAETAEIRKILSGFSKTAKPVDFPAYLRAVDRISGRAGLFMANDLEVAAARSLEGDLALSDMEPEDRVVELCSWTVSTDYTELKKMMIG